MTNGGEPTSALSRARCPRCSGSWTMQDVFVKRERLYEGGSRIMTGYGPGTAFLRLVCQQGHVFEATAVEEGDSWRLLEAAEQPGKGLTF